MFDLLKEYPSRFGIYDSYTLWLNIIGGISIAGTFFVIGLLFLVRAHRNIGKYSRLRLKVTRLFGWFLVACSFSRAIDVLCLWHNLALLSGYAKLLTGIIAFIAIYHIPTLLKDAASHEMMVDVKKEIEKTQSHLEKIEDISKKL